MNAVEIEEAVSQLASEPFDAKEFPFQFLRAFDNKETTISKLRSGASNASDVPNGILQRSNIHIATCAVGATTKALVALKLSPKTVQAKARYVLTTDGVTVEAEDLATGETIACPYEDLADRFAFFLPLAGISTVKQLRESSFDVRATGRLNKLYLELRRNNPSWDRSDRQHDMNHFMARLIFCFFAEDTDIFHGKNLFSQTIEQMSSSDATNTHEVIETIFRTMNLKLADRPAAKVPRWAEAFPYVNGGLFSGRTEVPKFTKMARIYLLHIGNLEWRKINPDIFGSMIQAVTDDDERGALGMHYTSVPNILKVLNPLFLDELRAKLDEAGDNARMLLNLRKRLARIRVFDPACGSGNFLVIAYKQMREIEAEINKRRGEEDRKSDIPITNFRGIEIREFPAEIARLALIIAEFQCDTLYLGQKEALQEFLPLDSENWITCGNALRLDWLSVCPPTGRGIKHQAVELFPNTKDNAQIDFENEGGEIYVCGNPPYKGRNKKEDTERSDTDLVFASYNGSFASLDYVANWFVKACHFLRSADGAAAFVSTNSIFQGEQVSLLWNVIFKEGIRISFAHTSFKWSNLATDKAGVTVIIVGITRATGDALLYTGNEVRRVKEIGPYLVPDSRVVVSQRSTPISDVSEMYLGNMAKDGGGLILSAEEGREAIDRHNVNPRFVRQFFGSEELIHAKPRACLWIGKEDQDEALRNAYVAERIERVRRFRSESKAPSTRAHAGTPHRFVQISAADGERAIVIPRVSSENRPYLPVDYLKAGPIIGDKCYAIYDSPLWNLAIIASKLHIVWIGTVCSRLRTDFSYGNKLGWNTFPVPTLTEQNKADLTRCAEDILLSRQAHFPNTIGELYDVDNMPTDLREAHERNDEVLERIYIGRRFRNDTERLEKLFELYTKMSAGATSQKVKRKKPKDALQ